MTESLFQKLNCGDRIIAAGSEGKINGTAWSRSDELSWVDVWFDGLPGEIGHLEHFRPPDAHLIELADPLEFFERRFNTGDVVSWGKDGLKGHIHYADGAKIVIDWFNLGRIIYPVGSPLLLEKLEVAR